LDKGHVFELTDVDVFRRIDLEPGVLQDCIGGGPHEGVRVQHAFKQLQTLGGDALEFLAVDALLTQTHVLDDFAVVLAVEGGRSAE